eukprot:3751098-Rhodomonas_salina.1
MVCRPDCSYRAGECALRHGIYQSPLDYERAMRCPVPSDIASVSAYECSAMCGTDMDLVSADGRAPRHPILLLRMVSVSTRAMRRRAVLKYYMVSMLTTRDSRRRHRVQAPSTRHTAKDDTDLAYRTNYYAWYCRCVSSHGGGMPCAVLTQRVWLCWYQGSAASEWLQAHMAASREKAKGAAVS